MTYTCTEERFLKDVESHKLVIIRDEGVNRHLRFRREELSTYWFDLITWKGYLCISGDMGCYVFARITDMFGFFDCPPQEGKELGINTGYWAEKVQAMDRHHGISRFSMERFEEEITERFIEYFDGMEDKKEKEDCWAAIKYEVLGFSSDEGRDAYRAASEFKHGDFGFHDFWEVNCNERPYQYIWCLYAIVWGISEYRASKAV